ncbi:barstar family protein [Streptomyces sp. NPDC049577]|uniref:barstar family protein n=1 Tax=Streptomyces sp. NPDC049577 TaxID=3155153 RepID=UPI003428A582
MTRPLPAPGLPALLGGPTPPGVYRLHAGENPSHVLALATESDWHAARLRLTGVTGKAGFLDRCAADLDFPDWFGRNWDALADCLTDLSWWREAGKSRGYLVLADGWDAFRTADPEVAGTAEEIFHEATDFWADRESPLTVLLA